MRVCCRLSPSANRRSLNFVIIGTYPFICKIPHLSTQGRILFLVIVYLSQGIHWKAIWLSNHVEKGFISWEMFVESMLKLENKKEKNIGITDLRR